MDGVARRIPGARESNIAASLLGTWGLYQVLAGLYFIFLRPSFPCPRTCGLRLRPWTQFVVPRQESKHGCNGYLRCSEGKCRLLAVS